MPEYRNGHWYIGNKKYKSKASATRAYRAYKAKSHGKKKRRKR